MISITVKLTFSYLISNTVKSAILITVYLSIFITVKCNCKVVNCLTFVQMKWRKKDFRKRLTRNSIFDSNQVDANQQISTKFALSADIKIILAIKNNELMTYLSLSICIYIEVLFILFICLFVFLLKYYLICICLSVFLLS